MFLRSLAQKQHKIKVNDDVLKDVIFLVQILNCVHARNQLCQTTSEMEEKFSYRTADEVLDVCTGI